MSPRFKIILIGVWLGLLGCLILAHLQISLRLDDLLAKWVPKPKAAPVVWDGVMPMSAKILVAVLAGFLLLIIWRKSRSYATGTLLVVFSFAPLVFAGIQIFREYLASDLAVFSDRFTKASGALVLSLAFLLIPAFGLLLSFARTKPTVSNHEPSL
jgi:hypothetical protein